LEQFIVGIIVGNISHCLALFPNIKKKFTQHYFPLLRILIFISLGNKPIPALH